MEYEWSDNVETKPGIGYPEKLGKIKEEWQGGWSAGCEWHSRSRPGSTQSVITKIFPPGGAADR
ncbi:hypothetical protein ACLK1S_09225 [Escherichia coli]